MTLALAVDLGGTKAEAAIVDHEGHVLEGSRHRAATGARAAADRGSLDQVLDDVIGRCSTHPAWGRVEAAGIGSAGPIDLERGEIWPVNLPAAHGYNVVDRVKQASGLSDVIMRLDGTCIALAEAWLGAARGVENAIVMVVSTGVGAGIISNGRLIAGRSGNAGHIGQTLIHNPTSSLGAASVEGLSSGPASVAWSQSQGWVGATGEDLATAFREGKPVARAAVERSARAVAVGLVNATTLLDLEIAVIGGGFASVTLDYTAMVQSEVQKNSITGYASRLRVVPAALGHLSPLIGAAALVHRKDLL